ncbi:hypothetical protein [Amycolatopsis sp. cmx-11-51]|uniref:hypothetical protein n=1 Tax=Amycolatopsis sp. cmx-11-51 TaxID=2785797 RepID=UPI0039E2C19C
MITMTFRLLDAPVVKETLAKSPGVPAVITSGWFFDEVVRNSAVADPATFRQVRVVVKETAAVAWVSRPDHPCPADHEVPAVTPPKQAEPERDGGAVTMTATSSDSGTVYQAARDQESSRAWSGVHDRPPPLQAWRSSGMSFPFGGRQDASYGRGFWPLLLRVAAYPAAKKNGPSPFAGARSSA